MSKQDVFGLCPATVILVSTVLMTVGTANIQAQALKPIETDQVEAPTNTPEEATANAKPDSKIDSKNVAEEIYAMTKGAKTGKDYSKIVTACEQALQQTNLSAASVANIKPIYSWALNRRGRKRLETSDAFASAENVEQAKLIFESAMKDFNDGINAAPDRWQTYLSRGIAFVSKENYELAVKDFSIVVEKHPKKTNGWFNRAEVYYAMGKFKEAIQDYDHCLKISAFDVQAVTGRAHAKYELGQLEQSLVDYEEAVRLAPHDPIALANRGDVHQALEQWGKAYDDYVGSVTLKPLAIGYQKAAWMLATCPSVEYFRPQSAVDMANKAIRLQGESLVNLETLAAAQASNGELQNAIVSQTKAVEAANEAGGLALEEAKKRLKKYETESKSETMKMENGKMGAR